MAGQVGKHCSLREHGHLENGAAQTTMPKKNTAVQRRQNDIEAKGRDAAATLLR